jgi:DNA polymerase I-like protein with 3'-5' exonuclease and polymerase domains
MDVEKLTDRLNALVQGTAADDLKLALALLWERNSESHGAVPVLVCHDEIVVECDRRAGSRRKDLAGEGNDRRYGHRSEQHG